MKYKITSVALALSIVLSMIPFAFAEEKADSHTVSYTLDEANNVLMIETEEETAFDGVVICAKYVSGGLSGLEAKEFKQIKKNDGKRISFDMRLDDADTKIIVWSDLSEMVPYTAVKAAEPTAEPTLQPTAEPTAEPTLQPTAQPTAEPTPEPTILPHISTTTASVTVSGTGKVFDDLTATINVGNSGLEAEDFEISWTRDTYPALNNRTGAVFGSAMAGNYTATATVKSGKGYSGSISSEPFAVTKEDIADIEGVRVEITNSDPKEGDTLTAKLYTGSAEYSFDVSYDWYREGETEPVLTNRSSYSSVPAGTYIVKATVSDSNWFYKGSIVSEAVTVTVRKISIDSIAEIALDPTSDFIIESPITASVVAAEGISEEEAEELAGLTFTYTWHDDSWQSNELASTASYTPANVGTYVVVATVDENDKYAGSISRTIYAGPIPITVVDRSIVVTDDTATITIVTDPADAVSGFTYTWGKAPIGENVLQKIEGVTGNVLTNLERGYHYNAYTTFSSDRYAFNTHYEWMFEVRYGISIAENVTGVKMKKVSDTEAEYGTDEIKIVANDVISIIAEDESKAITSLTYREGDTEGKTAQITDGEAQITADGTGDVVITAVEIE